MSDIAHHLGIDIAKKTFDVELLGADKPRRFAFSNTPQGADQLLKWLKRWDVERVHACMEATGTYGQSLARVLLEAGHVVSIVNPAAIKAAGQSELIRAKTDRVDAGIIARYCQRQSPRPWEPPPPEVERLQSLLSRLDDLIEMRAQEANRLSTCSQSTLASIETVIATLDHQIKLIEQEISNHIDKHPDLKRDQELLKSIPGIGKKTAALLVSLGLHRFATARHATAFLGLSPREDRSGTSLRKRGRICKVGNTAARSALYWPAITARRVSPVFADFAERLRLRGKQSLVVITAVMRKLLTIAYGVLKSRLPYDPARAAAHA